MRKTHISNYSLFNKAAVFLLIVTFVIVSSCKEEVKPSEEDTVKPEAGFTFVADELVVTFTHSSKGASTYAWDFGDGQTSDLEEPPAITYATANTYDVTLTVTRDNGQTDIITRQVTVRNSPVASFTSTPVGLKVTFTNTSSNASSYEWNFGDASPLSTETSPIHTFAASGSYTVKLTAIEGAYNDEITSEVTVSVPIASFEHVIDELEVTFTNTSENATSYDWDFGDGNTSTEASPVYTFAASGTYSVTLVATDGMNESNSTSKEIEVVNSPPPFVLEILEPGFEDGMLAGGTGDGRGSWKISGGNRPGGMAGTIQITGSPVFAGSQAAKLPSNNERGGYQLITVMPNSNYRVSFYYTMKTSPVGSLTVYILGGDVTDPADVAAATITSLTVNDQTAANTYLLETIDFNSGSNSEIAIYFINDGVETRLDEFSIVEN
ncbi:MAG: PKD domain-containing protein [Cyclobacteriaceae bacterium]|nr:PKD domain-containing protein [Cyclobacteriaceae bacterium]